MTRLIQLSALLLLSGAPHLFGQACSTSVPEIWVTKTVAPDTIFYEGAPAGTRSTVTLTAWASNCSTQTGNPIDVLFACDLSGSMSNADGTPNWRITWAQISARKFIDSLNNGFDRVGVLGWTANTSSGNVNISDTGNTAKYYKTVYPLNTDTAGAKNFVANNLYIDGSFSSVTYNGDVLVRRNDIPGGSFNQTPLKISTVVSLRYLRAHATNPAVLILLTDGESSGENYSDATAYAFVDSMYTNYGIRTFAIGMQGGNMAFLQTLAGYGGGNAYRATSPASLDSIFAIISLQISDVVAVSLSPTTPIFTEILGPNVHYYPGSYIATTGSNYLVPDSFFVDTVTGLTRLNFLIDTIRAGKQFELKYDITGAIYTPSLTPTQMRTNNTVGDNATYYSKIQYINADSVPVEKPIPKDFLYVKSGVGGLKISILPFTGTTYTPPAVSGTIPLVYSFATPDTYPTTTWYTLIQQLATNTALYTNVAADWYFTPPNADWIAPTPTYTGTAATNRNVGVVVQSPGAGSAYLKTRYSFAGTTYSDSVLFTATVNSSPEQVVGIVIDNNIINDGYINPPRITVWGDTSTIPAYTYNLYSIFLTDRGGYFDSASTWSIPSGFTRYSNVISTGSSPSRVLTLANMINTNFAQDDSGIIRITYNSFTFDLTVVIHDTTDYDTSDAVVIYDNSYGFNANTIQTNYPSKVNNTTYNPNAGDSIPFWVFAFDFNKTGIKYLSSPTANWTLNGVLVKSNASTYGIRKTTSYTTDTLVATWTNERGQVKTHTVYIFWDFGTGRVLSIERNSPTFGTNVASPILITDTTVMLNTDLVDTVYAVIRDQFGYAVYDTTAHYTSWSAVGGGASYVTLPSSAISTCEVNKTSNPPSDQVFRLIVTGLSSGGIGGLKDTVMFKLASYTYDKLDIFAVNAIQGFNAGDQITQGTVINLTCGTTGTFQARARHDGTLYDVRTATWTVSDANALSGTFPETVQDKALIPIRPTSGTQRVIATYVTPQSVTLRDTLLFTVPAATLTASNIFTSGVVANNGTLTGTSAYLKTLSFTLSDSGSYNCTGLGRSALSVDWTAPGMPAWFSTLVTQNGVNHITVSLATLPNTALNHPNYSFVIRTTYPSTGDTASFRFSVTDTTDYDSLQFLWVRTATSAAPTFAQLSNPTSTYTFAAGDTATFYSQLYDLNKGNQPKLVGGDVANWSAGNVNASSFMVTNTVPGQQIITVSYPATGSTLPSSYPNDASTSFTRTIVINWTFGTGRVLELVDGTGAAANVVPPITMPALPLSASATVYAVVRDQFGNKIGNATTATWSQSPSNAYLTIPGAATHVGLISKTSNPTSNQTYTVTATLAPNAGLGTTSTLSASVPVTIGAGIAFTDIRILTSGNAFNLTTTGGKTINGDNAVVLFSDIILLQACHLDPVFAVQIYDGTSWIPAQANWRFGSATANGAVNFTVDPPLPTNLDSLVATVTNVTPNLSTSIHFRINAAPMEEVWLTVAGARDADRRYTLSGTISSLRSQNLSLAVHGRTDCNADTLLASFWSDSAFTNAALANGIHALMGTTAVTSKTLNFLSLPLDTLPQDDSGFIRVSYADAVSGFTFRDSLKIIVDDQTDYDTADVMVVLPDSAYRATGNKNTLFNAFNGWQPGQAYAGDTLKFSALLFDLNSGGAKFLGNASVSYNNAQTFWKYIPEGQTGQLPFVAESLFTLSKTTPGNDTLIVLYGNNDQSPVYLDTLIIRWTFGRQRLLHLESSPAVLGQATLSLVDTLVFDLTKARDTVYAVVRDEFNTAISNGALETWSMTPSSYATYFTIPTSAPTNLGVVAKISTPGGQLGFDLVARLASGALPGVTAALYDTVKVVLNNYTFDSLAIVAGDSSVTPVRDTANVTYTAGQIIPNSVTLNLVALQDTIELKAILTNSVGGKVSQPVQWTLKRNSPMDDSIFPVSQRIVLKPVRGISRDTLIAVYNAGSTTLRDTVYFTVDQAWIQTIIIVYNDSNIAAGDTFGFTIVALDKNGDTVKNPARLPDGFNLTVDHPTTYIGSNDTANFNSTLFANDTFPNGLSTNRLVTYVAGTNQVIIEIKYPVGNQVVTFRDTLTIHTVAGAPDSIAVAHWPDPTPAVADTLSPIGTNTTAYYRVTLFDAYGNPLPDTSTAYAQYYTALQWNTIGYGLPGNFNRVGSYQSIFQYSAVGSTGGEGRAIVNLGAIRDSFYLSIIPVVDIMKISTHEWTADTTTEGIDEVLLVLDSVLGIDTDSLVALANSDSSANWIYLSVLRANGYQSYGDGYLDYLNITLSDSFQLSESYVDAITFDASIDTIEWTARKALPANPMGAKKQASFRLWLAPNHLDSAHRHPLETGFLPRITINNQKIRAVDTTTGYPVLLGNGGNFFTTDTGVTLDSAPPVIKLASLQNNVCNPENPENTVTLGFSETMRHPAGFPKITALMGLALVNGSKPADTLFTRTSVVEGDKVDLKSVNDSAEVFWSYTDQATQMTAYRFSVALLANNNFKPSQTRIRFAVTGEAGDWTDLTGLSANLAPNQAVELDNDTKAGQYICAESGNNVVDRYSSVGYSWSQVKDENGSPVQVPEFPYFGITVNLDLATASQSRTTIIRQEFTSRFGEQYVIADYDTTFPFIMTQVVVFDLLGNRVASPAHNDGLTATFTIKEVYKADQGLVENAIRNVDTLSLEGIEKYFIIFEAVNPADPDTLRPILPATFAINYQYLLDNCGPGAATGHLCVPAWNCLNEKGRIVAPGGYIAVQSVSAGGVTTERVRKLIVTSGAGGFRRVD